MNAFSLRDLESHDRAAVIDLLHELNRFEDAITGDRATDRKAAAACFADDAERMREHGGMQLVAELTGKPVGYICCVIVQAGPFVRAEQRMQGCVTTLVVAKTARGQGIGLELMRAAEDFTRGQGLRRFMVGHVAGNEGAARLYDKMGLAPNTIERVKTLD